MSAAPVQLTFQLYARHPHSQHTQASVMLEGDGGLEHMLDLFKAALVVSGYAPKTAAALTMEERAGGTD